MPRYYFHIATDTEVFPDAAGMEVPDDAAAHHYAIQLISKIMLHDPEERDWRGWRVEVVNSEQAAVLTVLYPRYQWAPRTAFEYGAAPFGRRTNWPVKLLNLLCIAGSAMFISAAPEQAITNESFSCIETVGSLTYTFNSGHPSSGAGILRIDPADDTDRKPRKTARERKWIER